jgi:NTE family protein
MSSSDTSGRLVEVGRDTAAVELKPRAARANKETHGLSATALRKSHRNLERPPFQCIALVLQGGGALGAFQAGVYQALVEANLHPNWVSGISIGAINAALIAGNAPQARLEKLHAFWDQVTAPHVPDPFGLAESYFGLADSFLRGDFGRGFLNRLSANSALINGAPGFFKSRMPPPYLSPPGTIEATSWYDTAPLKATLEGLVDFDRINSGEMRFSIGAVNIRSGNFVYFDSNTHTIKPEHVLASGALPPGFPPVEIEGELYWDGGLVSNTPLQWVVSGDTRQDTLAFQVDLWSARGEVPSDLSGVMVRQKEIQYSSRTRANTDFFKAVQRARGAVESLLKKLPQDLLDSEDGKVLQAVADHKVLGNILAKLPPELVDSEDCRILRAVVDRSVYKIVHLIYRSKNYEGQSKDYDFSRLSMRDHWQAGYNDTIRTLRHPEALHRPSETDRVETFDLAVNGRE